MKERLKKFINAGKTFLILICVVMGKSVTKEK